MNLSLIAETIKEWKKVRSDDPSKIKMHPKDYAELLQECSQIATKDITNIMTVFGLKIEIEDKQPLGVAVLL